MGRAPVPCAPVSPIVPFQRRPRRRDPRERLRPYASSSHGNWRTFGMPQAHVYARRCLRQPANSACRRRRLSAWPSPRAGALFRPFDRRRPDLQSRFADHATVPAPRRCPLARPRLETSPRAGEVPRERRLHLQKHPIPPFLR